MRAVLREALSARRIFSMVLKAVAETLHAGRTFEGNRQYRHRVATGRRMFSPGEKMNAANMELELSNKTRSWPC